MKKITKTEIVPKKVIPSYEKEVIEFICDIDSCDFKTDSEKAAEKHLGEEHAVIDEKYIYDNDFYYFKTKEAAEAWLKTRYYDYSNIAWVGEGWYGEEIGTKPCPRGCCEDSYLTLRYYSTFLSDWKNDLKSLQEGINELELLQEKE